MCHMDEGGGGRRTHIRDGETGSDQDADGEPRIVPAEDVVKDRKGGELRESEADVKHDVARVDDFEERNDVLRWDLTGWFSHVLGRSNERTYGDTEAKELLV